MSLAIALGPAPAGAQTGVALVLGNAHYPNLPNDQQPARVMADVVAVARSLVAAWYEVRRGTNLSRRDLLETLAAFSQAIRPGDLAVLYYAGHGVTIGDVPYLVPADVPAEISAGGLRSALVSLDHVIADIQGRRPRALVIVLDAMRGNPVRASGATAGPNVRDLVNAPLGNGIFAIYSAGTGQIALDRLGPGDTQTTSLFARVFAQHVPNGYSAVALGEIMQSVAKSVSAQARTARDANDRPAPHEQTPTFYDQTVGGPVYLGVPRETSPSTQSSADTLIRTVPNLPMSAPAPSSPPRQVQVVPIFPNGTTAPAVTAAPPPAQPARAYVVQVVSQRTEEDARTAYATLQAKYPQILGGREPLIARADLGERGVYYRGQIGPFPSAEAAGELCHSLKDVGAQCVVQRQ